MASSFFQLKLPWLPISWKGASDHQPLRFVLIARKAEDTDSLELVELPDRAGCRTFIAAQIDADQRVFHWFEVQVQTPQALTQSPAALSGFLNNAVLDAEWKRHDETNTDEAMTFADADSGEPWVIDLDRLSVTSLLHRETGAPLRLCRDQVALLKAGKPAYGETLQRWFRSETPSGESRWLDLMSPSAESRNALILENGGDRFIDFNLSAGKLRVRRHRLLSLRNGIDFLREQLGLKEPGGPAGPAGDLTPAALLAQQVVEALRENSAEKSKASVAHLSALEKLFPLLNLWRETVHLVTQTCGAAQRPFLNLGLDSFRVGLDFVRQRLRRGPLDLELTRTADAIPVEIEPGNLQFIPCTALENALSLDRFGGWRTGAGTVRFSQVSDAGAGPTRVEGVLDAPLLRDSIEASLVWIQMTLEGKPLNFLAHLENDQGGARGGVRFRAALSLATPEAIKALKSPQTPRRPCQFSVLQPISAAQDIYHLGTMGLRILLANTDDAVTEVEDDLFELASLIPRGSGIAELRALVATSDLNERLRRLLTAEKWFSGVTDPSIPTDLWLAVLHELIEFVAVEEHTLDEQAEGAQAWLRPLLRRSTALDRLVTHTEGLLWTPRAVDEEIGRIVHRFLPSE